MEDEMKYKIILMVACVLFLFSCENTSEIEDSDYALAYYNLIESFESELASTLYREGSDMLDMQWYAVEYSHPDFKHYVAEMIVEMDDMLYEFSQLGPKLNDETLMKYQSKLEFALYDLMNTLKTFQDHDIYNTNVPNQFALYTEVYELLKLLSPELDNYNRLTLEIEMHLRSLGYEATETYYMLKYANGLRANYLYAILSSQVSMYQDYTGLRVQPRNTMFINLTDNKWCIAPEMDSGVMLSTCKNIKTQLDFFEVYLSSFGLEENKKTVAYYLEGFIKTYGVYVEYRTELPYDFFKSGEFAKYQIYTDRDFPGNYAYYFDPKYNEEYHFDLLESNYRQLRNAIYNQPHMNYMMY